MADVPTSPPMGPQPGDRFTDADDGRTYKWNGSAWIAEDDKETAHG